MQMYDLIQKKKNGEALTPEEIRWFIQGYTAGEIPDYQASALLMAIYFQGMTDEETSHLTMAMRDSGDQADLSCFGGLTADKHSTGGVGDKTSLIVAPLAASLGCKVAKMSGRGLGHTGGTVDKLESIPGFRTSLSPEEFRQQVQDIGLAIVGQSGNFAPADKKLYALRDVTATIDSVPLIAASIMSKKLAAGSEHIVLDVKTGSGAFMKTTEEARKLAEKMVAIGYHCGRKTAAVLTNMDIPLGHAIGNALEVKEALAVLQNRAEGAEDLREVCLTLAAEMVSLCFDLPFSEAKQRCEENLANGRALAVFRTWIARQGGDTDFIDHPEQLCPAAYSGELPAEADGYIVHMDAEKIGRASVLLGAGRMKKGDPIDFSAGLRLKKKTGDFVKAGESIATLYSSSTSDFTAAAELLRDAVRLAPQPPQPAPLVYEILCR